MAWLSDLHASAEGRKAVLAVIAVLADQLLGLQFQSFP